MTTDPLVVFAQNVRRRRRALELTQEAAGNRGDMDMSYWGRVERAKIEPGVRSITRMATALETTPAELMAGVGRSTARAAQRPPPGIDCGVMGVAASHEEGDSVAPDDPTPIRRESRGGSGGAPSGGAPGAKTADLEQAIAVLRARVDEEFRISERLDSKGRQAFALAAGFFAVVQTVAFGSFAADGVHTAERVFVGVLAVIAGLAVFATANRLANGEDLHEEDDLRPSAVVKWCNDANADDYVAVRIVSRLATVADNRTLNNKIRSRNYDAVQTATRWALILTGVELIVGILVRI